MEVSSRFQGCFKEVSRVFQGSFKAVSREFPVIVKENINFQKKITR